MKWFAHSVVAGSTAAIIAPPLVPAAIAGGTAPDWFEWIVKATGTPIEHRGPTHYLSHWAIASVISIFIHPIAAAFCLGGLSHILLDAMTVSGVPASPWSQQRMHLFGGRFRTGEPGEYIFSLVWGIICFAMATTMLSSEFMPFFYNWSELYDSGLIDGSEWKLNRFKLI